VGGQSASGNPRRSCHNDGKKFVCENLNAGTSYVLRSVEPYFSTGKIIVGDSAFGSVQTAVALLLKGLFGIFIVKTARKMFPKAYFKEVPMANRGDTLALSAVKDSVEVKAICWNEPGKPGKPRKHFIATCSTTLPADPIERTRYRKNKETGEMDEYVRQIPVCEAVRPYFGNAGAIDRFNRVRQDGIRIQDRKKLGI
jgi:hypothetical protein